MHLSNETEQRLRELVRVFLEENSKVNLSAFRTPERCWVGNVLDSLAFLELGLQTTPRAQASEPRADHKLQTLLDLGTGGGFPLLPLAICLPDAHCVGIDATRKKIEAVKRIVAKLGLANVELHWGRAEELGSDIAHHERYDIVTIRAVKKIVENLHLAAPFLKPKGHVVLWKSMKVEKELSDATSAMAELSLRLAMQHRYFLPEDWGERQLLVFEKTK